jgi:biotin operon repressor
MSTELSRIIQENPQITYKEIQQKYPDLKFTTGAFYSTRFRLGLSTPNPSHYTKKTNQIVNQQTVKQKLLTLLESSHQGISSEDIIKTLKITSSSMYTSIYGLKKDGYNIKSKNGKYFYKHPKTTSLVVSKTQPDSPLSTLTTTTDIPHVSQKLLKDMGRLTDSDRNDFLDLLKKSVFYKLSANALLQANNFVEELKNSTLIL